MVEVAHFGNHHANAETLSGVDKFGERSGHTRIGWVDQHGKLAETRDGFAQQLHLFAAFTLFEFAQGALDRDQATSNSAVVAHLSAASRFGHRD